MNKLTDMASFMSAQNRALYSVQKMVGNVDGTKNMKSLLSSYTWAFPPRPFTHHVRWITVDPNNPNTIYVSIEAGAVIQSNDKGHTWIDKNSVLYRCSSITYAP